MEDKLKDNLSNTAFCHKWNFRYIFFIRDVDRVSFTKTEHDPKYCWRFFYVINFN